MTVKNESKYLFWLIIIILSLQLLGFGIWKAEKIVQLKSGHDKHIENRIIGLEGEVQGLKKYLGLTKTIKDTIDNYYPEFKMYFAGTDTAEWPPDTTVNWNLSEAITLKEALNIPDSVLYKDVNWQLVFKNCEPQLNSRIEATLRSLVD